MKVLRISSGQVRCDGSTNECKGCRLRYACETSGDEVDIDAVRLVSYYCSGGVNEYDKEQGEKEKAKREGQEKS